MSAVIQSSANSVVIPRASTQPRMECFWQIVRSVAPPWNSKYGSCILPETNLSVFFGGSSGNSDVWVCNAQLPSQGSPAPLWTKLSLPEGGGSGDGPSPAPRLFPLMVGISSTKFIVAGGAQLTLPWSTYTDAFVGSIDFEDNTISWSAVVSHNPSISGAAFTYEHADHSPISTNSLFMRSLEGVLVSAMPTKASAFEQVHQVANPGAQKNTLVVTVYRYDAATEFVTADYHIVKSPHAPFGGAWPSSDLQSIRLVPLLDGFAFGYVVPRAKQYADISGAASWILSLSCADAGSGSPPIRYTWTNVGGFRNAPTLRSGAALFHSSAGTPSGAVVAIYGGSAIWTPRANAAHPGTLSSLNDQGRSLLPLNVGLFMRNPDGAFSFLWQNPYMRLTPPVASDQPLWDGEVTPAEARAFFLTNVNAITIGFVHYGGFWRSPTNNATTITVLTVPRTPLLSGVSDVGGTQPAIRFFANGEAFGLPNVARI